LNPLLGNYTDSNFFSSDGNLSITVTNNSGYRNYPSTFSPENLKGYLELRWSTGTPNGQIGITDVTKQDTNVQYQSAGTFFIDQNGNVRNGPTTVKSGCTPSFSSGDTLQIAFDFTGSNKNIWFGRNGTWGDNTVGTGNPSSGTNPMFNSSDLTGEYRFYFGINTGAGTQIVTSNFGQNPTFGNIAAVNKNRINDSTADSVWHQSSNTGTHTDWTVASGGTELDVAVPSGHYARVKLRSVDGTIDLKKTYLLSFKYTTGPANLGVQNDQGYMTAVDGSVSPSGLSSGNSYSFVIHGTSEVSITGFTGSTYALDNVIVSEIDECYTDDSGKGKFHYQPPTGYLALCEDNLPTPAIADPGDHFKCVLYTGTATSNSIKKVGFQPDLVWVKKRSTAGDHKLVDSVRGAGFVLESNTTDVEGNETINFTGFNSDGFDLGNNGAGAWNENSHDYVAWCWKAGGAAVSNTDGSITSQVSVNQDAGFSIVSYTGNVTNLATVGHGLNKKVKFMITKSRTTADNWVVHTDVTGTQTYSFLNTSAALNNDSISAPTSSVFYRGTSNTINGNNLTYVSYCWAEIEGYSKFGSYVGNGDSDGVFVYCGFKPAWMMYKRTDTTGNWIITDSSRNSTNPSDLRLFADTSGVESDLFNVLDFVSNGFKFRTNASSTNGSGATYIFMAFAESPFQTANAK